MSAKARNDPLFFLWYIRVAWMLNLCTFSLAIFTTLLREIDRIKALVRHALKSQSPRCRLAEFENAGLLRIPVGAVQRISA